jgi:molecular chaperone HtpG
MTVAQADAPEQLEFKTELKQLLELITHSLYTKKEIFLRELISNAADAIDKLRFESLKDPSLTEGDSDWKIKLIPDEKAGTLTISDNGCGMTREEIIENLGTIARSGTRAFLDTLKQANAQQRPELIGQFGVGFYSSFMVADRVAVVSRSVHKDAQAVRWESDGAGTFTTAPAEKASRGTEVILHLREDAKEFFSPWKLREIVKRYSDYIEHPIVMDVEKGKEGEKTVEEETLNSRQAIWLRPKSQVKEEEYAEFYKQISRDEDAPLKTIHIAAEGAMEFRALLFIPGKRGYDWMAGPEKKSSIDLYVRRVLITHDCEQVIAQYFRFVRGVVDSADLPLNVSRETLQHNPLLAKIKSNLVNRILKTLEEMKDAEYEKYKTFYEEFGSYLKEGAGQDWSNRERLADLLLFESTKTAAGEFTTLAKYAQAMPSDQKEIYYLIGESRAMIDNSPYLESFKAKGQEVLLLTDPVDEFLVSSMRQYKDKSLHAVDRGDIEADKDAQEKQKAEAEQFKTLFEKLQAQVPEVKEVRLSARLKESAAVLVADEGAIGAHMERLLGRMGRGHEIPPSKRILELNPDHPLVKAMQTIAAGGDDPRLQTYARVLYDLAVIAEGSRVQDPGDFARRVNELLVHDAEGRVSQK